MRTAIESSQRYPSVDLLRGFAVASMILVNHAGDSSKTYSQLLHAPWHGFTFADLVFPLFLFVVGVSIPLALGRPLEERSLAKWEISRRILRRSLLLVLLGILLNGFPFWNVELARWRLPGVLQRIGLCYGAAAVLWVALGRRTRIAVAAALLTLYWIAMLFVPVPGHGAGDLSPAGNLAAWLDHRVFGKHTWRHAPGPGDPEGLLSTLPAIVTALLGTLAGEALRSGASRLKRGFGLATGGVALTGTGLFLQTWIPLNKQLWTPSFVLLTAGIALLLLTLLESGAPELGTSSLLQPFHWMGRNALATYVGSVALARLLLAIRFETEAGRTSLYRYLYRSLFEAYLPPYWDSLIFALAHLLFWTLVAYGLYRKQFFIKV